jgi:hypothetical protein
MDAMVMLCASKYTRNYILNGNFEGFSAHLLLDGCKLTFFRCLLNCDKLIIGIPAILCGIR